MHALILPITRSHLTYARMLVTYTRMLVTYTYSFSLTCSHADVPRALRLVGLFRAVSRSLQSRYSVSSEPLPRHALMPMCPGR